MYQKKESRQVPTGKNVKSLQEKKKTLNFASTKSRDVGPRLPGANKMLNHLIGESPDIELLDDVEPAFEPVKRVSPQRLINAQAQTCQWLAELGAPGDEAVIEEQQKAAARDAFLQVATAQPEDAQRASLLQIKSPAAMTHLSALLEAHDWEFVARAKELRSYAVTKILKETEHVDARIRLKALDMLGKVTEVGLFTERIEVKKVEVGDTELEERIRERLEKFLVASGTLVDAEEKQVAEDVELKALKGVGNAAGPDPEAGA